VCPFPLFYLQGYIPPVKKDDGWLYISSLSQEKYIFPYSVPFDGRMVQSGIILWLKTGITPETVKKQIAGMGVGRVF